MIDMLKNKLMILNQEHRMLDDSILQMMEKALYDQLEVQRLKRKKLRLKDEIIKIQTQMIPDIIA